MSHGSFGSPNHCPHEDTFPPSFITEEDGTYSEISSSGSEGGLRQFHKDVSVFDAFFDCLMSHYYFDIVSSTFYPRGGNESWKHKCSQNLRAF